MARWVTSPVGAVNLDQLAQLGVEGWPAVFEVVGWSPDGARFSVADGFATRSAALEWIVLATGARVGHPR